MSHETIYKSLFVQTRGVLKKELQAHLHTQRVFPGHWEGDLISGSGNTHIATLVERQSRFTMLVNVAGKDTNSVVSALTRHVKKLPRLLR